MSTNTNNGNNTDKPEIIIGSDVPPTPSATPSVSPNEITDSNNSPSVGISTEGVNNQAPPNQDIQQVPTPGGPPAVQETEFSKKIKDIMVTASKEKIDKITESLSKGMIRLEYADSKGNVKEDVKDYVPLSIGKNKQIMKAMKKSRRLRTELENPNFVLDELKQKYPEILDEDVEREDLESSDMLNEILGNYVVAQKSRIYFGIDNIDNYTLNDLVLLIGLYERRNNFTPY